jgi:hypothetical protein
MHDNYFSERFPEMRPISAPPSLSTVNGIGTMAYGRRDYDPETYTYVKTRYFTLLYIPVLALGAYRVADAPNGGWYFLGKVPLSPAARFWNYFLLICVLGGVGFGIWHHHVNTPEYLAAARAREKMYQADQFVSEGKIGQAAALYRDLALGRGEHATDALANIGNLLNGPVDQAPASEAAAYYRTALEIRRRLPDTLPDLPQSGLKSADHRSETDPRGALLILDAVAPALNDRAQLGSRRLQLLEKVMVKDPDDLEVRGQLAEVYESKRDDAKCEQLLLPFRDRLGTTTGARVLGQLFARQGKLDDAYALLQAYTHERLQNLQNAEDRIRGLVQELDQEIFNTLKTGKAPDFDYARYRNAPAAEQQRLVNEYINGKLRELLEDDPALRQAQEESAQQGRVVPVALDLGVVILRRAQAEPDLEKRKQELEKAEKTFLAVRGVAGQNEEFSLNLGQVYYWLGKLAEGRKLFDQLLETHGRDTKTMLVVAQVLQEVGAFSEARTLAEEAYQKETKEDLKQQAADVRAILRIDLDDEITWLNRCNSAKPEVQMALGSARGQQALREGNEAAAVKFFREAAANQARIPESAAALNNGALVQFNLYRLTRDRATLDRGTEMIERALALEPRNSVLLINVAALMLEMAILDLLAPSVDLRVLKRGAGLDLLPHLYQDAAGRARVAGKIAEHPGARKSIEYFERGLTLAPRRAGSYSSLNGIYEVTRDLPALRELWSRAKDADLDLVDAKRQTLDYVTGKKDADLRKDLQAVVARYEEEVKRVRPGGGKTLALALYLLVRNLEALEMVGGPADHDHLVRLAEEAETVSPSQATRLLLEGALFRPSRRGACQNRTGLREDGPAGVALVRPLEPHSANPVQGW